MMVFLLTGCNSSDYKKALQLYEDGQYEEAISAFEALGDYKDSADQIVVCRYAMANAMIEEGSFAEALPILRELGDYEDAPALRRSAAYEAVRDYLKETGTAYNPLESAAVEDTDFHYAISEKEDVSFRYIALDSDDALVLGTGRDASNSLVGVIAWTFWITVPETGDTATTNYVDASSASGSVGGEVRSVQTLQTGESSFDITKYTENQNVDMTIQDWMKDYKGQETTKTKNLSDSKNSQAMLQMGNTPISVEDLLADAGVTLGDLGFTMLDTATEEPAADNSTDESGAGASAGSTTGDAIALQTEDGQAEIKYNSVEYIADDVLADESVDSSKVIIVKMDYTNKSDDPKMCQEDFWFRVFQNGVELDSSFASYYPDRAGAKSLEDYYKQVMGGGTVTCGKYFLLEDDSPITIIANVQSNGDLKQSMTVDLG